MTDSTGKIILVISSMVLIVILDNFLRAKVFNNQVKETPIVHVILHDDREFKKEITLNK
jgi:hypothetical protein